MLWLTPRRTFYFRRRLPQILNLFSLRRHRFRVLLRRVGRRQHGFASSFSDALSGRRSLSLAQSRRANNMCFSYAHLIIYSWALCVIYSEGAGESIIYQIKRDSVTRRAVLFIFRMKSLFILRQRGSSEASSYKERQ